MYKAQCNNYTLLFRNYREISSSSFVFRNIPVTVFLTVQLVSLMQFFNSLLVASVKANSYVKIQAMLFMVLHSPL